LLDQKIDINSGDWKKKNECIYYSQEKRAWYCSKCYEIIKSPRTANTHAGYHTLTLPCSRRKPEAKKIEVKFTTDNPPQQIPIPQKETHYQTYSETKNYSSFPRNNREYNDITSPNYVPTTPLDKKIWKRYQGKRIVDSMRLTGVFTDEEIEKKEIEFGLKQKEEPPKNEGLKNAAIMALQNRYLNEYDEGVKAQILFTMSLIENEKDPKNIPVLLSMAPRPKPKESNSSKNMLLMMACLYLDRKQKEASILNSPEKIVEIMQILRKKPSRNQNPTETAIPLTPSDNGLDQNIKP